MRGYSTISDEERNSILQQHSSFYNGYAVGNVPNEPQPLRVDKGASDPNGITVDNKGNVKTYQNHKINESVISEDINEIEADDMDISDEESAYSFKSDGPEQFDSSYTDDSYGLDIDSIMKMFGTDMSPAQYHDEKDMMNGSLDGKEKFNDEDSAYKFDSQGGNAAVYYEEEQCEGCGEKYEEEVKEKEVCEGCGSEMYEGECMECGSLYEEIDEDLHESFSENRKQIKEMMNRFNKFN